ncbi:MAG: four-helix bundle copper-binding protein [Bacteroidota bacterium]
MNANNAELHTALINCARACEYCATCCLDEDDLAMLAECIRVDRDCADICTLSATLLARESSLATQLLLLCEEACRLCADNCAQHSHHDHCRECAEACRRCAELCHENHTAIEQV